jgi:diguanylate cyclase (GGDEF)-like protein
MVAERIRQSVEQCAFLDKEGLNLRFTVSIGVALFPDNAKSKKEIIEAADQAMYDAKKTARNHVSVATIKPSKAKEPEGG